MFKVKLKISLILITVIVLLMIVAVSAEAQTATKAPTAQPQPKIGNLEGYILLEGHGCPAEVNVVQSTNVSNVYATTFADGNGHYRIEDLPVKTYKLNVTPNGTYGGWPTSSFTVTSGNTTRQNVEIVYKTGTIMGNVKLENKPLPGANIYLFDPESPLAPCYETTTNSNGDFSIDVVASDSKIKPLSVPARFMLVAESERTSASSVRQGVISVKGGQKVQANMGIFFQKGNITGVVLNESGAPVSYAKMELHLVNETYLSPEVANTTTDANGTYMFKNAIATPGNGSMLWPGEWQPDYQYEVIGYLSENMSQVSEPQGLEPYSTRYANFTFPDQAYATGTIEGYLTTDTGYAIPNVTVNLMGTFGKSSRIIAKSLTGPDGYYSFNNTVASDSPLKPNKWTGNYMLNYQKTSPQFNLSSGERVTENLTLTAQPYIVLLIPDSKYVSVDGQCSITPRIYDRWGNPYTKQTKILVELARNESTKAQGPGGLNSNNLVTLVLDATDGSPTINYGWVHPAYTWWSVTINSSVYTKSGNTITSQISLTIVPTGWTAPVEPVSTPTPIATPTPSPVPDIPSNDTSTVTESPTPSPSPVPGNSGNIIDQIIWFLQSLFNGL